MVDPSLRIRLEGRVEALERSLLEWSLAVKAAQRREFGPAVALLERGDEALSGHGDDALEGLLSLQLSLRRQVERLVTSRLRLLGVPVIDLAAGAKWLQAEPILYEHHCLTTAFLFRGPLFALWCMGMLVFGLRSMVVGPLIVLGLLYFAAQKFGRSDVVLTRRRLILEGQVIDLAHVRHVLVIRPFMQFMPMSFEVEVRGESGHLLRDVRVRQASTGLRAALMRLRLNTGGDWGPC